MVSGLCEAQLSTYYMLCDTQSPTRPGVPGEDKAGRGCVRVRVHVSTLPIRSSSSSAPLLGLTGEEWTGIPGGVVACFVSCSSFGINAGWQALIFSL